MDNEAKKCPEGHEYHNNIGGYYRKKNSGDNTTLWVKKTTKARLQTFMQPTQTVDVFINVMLDRYMHSTQIPIVQKLETITKQSGKQVGNWLEYPTDMGEEEFVKLADEYEGIAILSYDSDTGTISLFMEKI